MQIIKVQYGADAVQPIMNATGMNRGMAREAFERVCREFVDEFVDGGEVVFDWDLQRHGYQVVGDAEVRRGLSRVQQDVVTIWESLVSRRLA